MSKQSAPRGLITEEQIDALIQNVIDPYAAYVKLHRFARAVADHVWSDGPTEELAKALQEMVDWANNGGGYPGTKAAAALAIYKEMING